MSLWRMNSTRAYITIKLSKLEFQNNNETQKSFGNYVTLSLLFSLFKKK